MVQGGSGTEHEVGSLHTVFECECLNYTEGVFDRHRLGRGKQ